jgi:release factor glutamine methyltransferase
VTLAETLHDAEARLRAAGIDDARLEAELLLCHALELTREGLFARLRESLAKDAQNTFEALLHRRLAHEPTAYIVERKEFYGLEFACTPAALIPRPETELLVDEAIDWLRRRERGARSKEERLLRPSVVDVGTGNGAIAVALAVHHPKASIVAIDPSRAALQLARHNAKAHRVADRIAFVQGELLAPLRTRVDLIVANLPYIPTRLYAKLTPEIREHEPAVALHAGRRGTTLIAALLTQAPAHLQPGSLLLAEHAWNQGKRLREAARASFPDAAIATRRDLAGLERMLIVQKT